MYHPINSQSDTRDLLKTLAKRMDFSCVRSIHDKAELQQLVCTARRYRPACVFVLPSLADWMAMQLQDIPGVKLGGAVGFPSGGDTTESKVFQTRELSRKGCGELDMVMNLSLLKLEEYQRCREDIRKVVFAASGIPVKVIIEAAFLTEDEIHRASELAVSAGAAFVKTGTGWNGPVTKRQVELIYQAIGDAAFIKAAGGIRTLEAVKELYGAGCDRFGIGVAAAEGILE